jgi:hypothetical protein
MTDKEALRRMRVLTLLHKDAEGAPPEHRDVVVGGA